ncbi:MAG TPA: ribonuclease Y [Deltaproteobacteria bacterium]|nr:ribonuclease Y [Deltaproteobacteria bacterium]
MAFTVTAVAVLAMLAGVALGYVFRKSFLEKSLEGAKNSAENIIADARKEADNILKEASLQAKDRIYQSKLDLERELKESRKEISNLEKRLVAKEESLDKKFESLDRRDAELKKRERNLDNQERRLADREKQIEKVLAEQRSRLEGMAGMTAEEAKRMLLESMEEEAKLDAAKMLKRIEEETRAEADRRAKDIISLAIQRYAGDYVSERTVSVLALPSDEMKGRIIGREGRNIRAIEAATGIDIIIDDTPEAVILSGHNPVRREIARLAIERLVTDGRIHPARIEEIVGKVEKEINQAIMEAGERAVFDAGLHGIHPEIQKLIGRLKFRTSYAQNVYAHSLEVAFICGVMAAELGLSVKQARRAGLLHDIGKAVDHEVEGPHAAIGADIARKYNESPRIVAAIASHHDDEPGSVLGVLVQAADTLSAARPGARREMIETYVKRLEDLEKIAKSFKGVEKSYALQAGRELRVIVENKATTDEGAVVLSKDIAKKIEKELSYPGQIKVTVIRETRAVNYAR